MPIITLPDGKQLSFAEPVTILQIAERIGTGLARAALAGKVNGHLVDCSQLITKDAEVAIITATQPEGLDVIRHSTAHLLAQAVKQLFPMAQVTIGPVIEDGFYYDFAFARPFTPEDLTQIEAVMADLVKTNQTVTRLEWSRSQATDYFVSQGEHYKAKIIADIPETEILSLYQQDDFIDLCRGPHVPNTGKLGVFKLMKVAGAYWRGDSKNEMLQRIYGTAWANKQDLQTYLQRLEEAAKRDHRRIGKQLDLFHIQEEAPGMIFWHAKGWAIYQVIEQYLRQLLWSRDYQEVRTPQVLDRSLWEHSGHWDKFRKEMFTTGSENREYAIKPMSCPCHIQIFNQTLHSYRELPLRLAEFGSCHRNEPSGSLHGILRVRNFVQDDAHIFCTENQIQTEVATLIDLVFKVYADFGFNDVIIRLATRPSERVGSDASWDKAETALITALQEKHLTFEELPGEGAFYGPKIEFSLKDCLGRVWQCGTVQIDFSMPQRLGAVYIDEQGQKQTPVMLHRALIGTFERFIGILLEHYAGILSPWLAPVQAVVMNITDRQTEAVTQVTNSLRHLGFRVVSDLRNEKIGFKIREHTLMRIPFLLVIGDREAENNTMSVRRLQGDDLGIMNIMQFQALLTEEVAKKSKIGG